MRESLRATEGRETLATRGVLSAQCLLTNSRQISKHLISQRSACSVCDEWMSDVIIEKEFVYGPPSCLKHGKSIFSYHRVSNSLPALLVLMRIIYGVSERGAVRLVSLKS